MSSWATLIVPINRGRREMGLASVVNACLSNWISLCIINSWAITTLYASGGQ